MTIILPKSDMSAFKMAAFPLICTCFFLLIVVNIFSLVFLVGSWNSFFLDASSCPSRLKLPHTSFLVLCARNRSCVTSFRATLSDEMMTMCWLLRMNLFSYRAIRQQQLQPCHLCRFMVSEALNDGMLIDSLVSLSCPSIDRRKHCGVQLTNNIVSLLHFSRCTLSLRRLSGCLFGP